jgi:signal transduction histidine kinase
MTGLLARDILAKNTVPVDAESRLGDVQEDIEKTRATHVLVYDKERFCGVVPLHMATSMNPHRIFADLLPRVSPPMIPDSTPLQLIADPLQNSIGGVVCVSGTDGTFLGIITQEGFLHALLGEARRQLEDFGPSLGKPENFRVIERIIKGIAHDLNNILFVVLGNLRLINQKECSDAEEKELLHIALTAAGDASNAVRRLQNFYHASESADDGEVFDLSTIAREVSRFTKPKWFGEAKKDGKNIEMELDLSSVPPVRGNPGEIREVLINLIINAIDAIAENGTIRIRVHANGNFVYVEVADSGSGMDEEQSLHCLEPFYTTKSASGGGTGLGLSMCSDIVKKHGGNIQFKTELGKGTSFSISLPTAGVDDQVHEKTAPGRSLP